MPDTLLFPFGLNRPKTEALWQLFFPKEDNGRFDARLQQTKKALNGGPKMWDEGLVAAIFNGYIELEHHITRNSLVAPTARRGTVLVDDIAYSFLDTVPSNRGYLQLNGEGCYFILSALSP